MNVQPGSVSFACLYLLSDGPATTSEVAAETAINGRKAHAYMRKHEIAGRVQRVPFWLGQCRQLWQITAAGRLSLRAAIAKAVQP